MRLTPLSFPRHFSLTSIENIIRSKNYVIDICGPQRIWLHLWYPHTLWSLTSQAWNCQNIGDIIIKTHHSGSVTLQLSPFHSAVHGGWLIDGLGNWINLGNVAVNVALPVSHSRSEWPWRRCDNLRKHLKLYCSVSYDFSGLIILSTWLITNDKMFFGKPTWLLVHKNVSIWFNITWLHVQFSILH